MSNSNSSMTGGIGFGGALMILFIGLKLGGVIDWSWWWVYSPALIPVAVLLLIVGVVMVVALWPRRKRRRGWES